MISQGHWVYLFSTTLFIVSFSILFLAGMFMCAESYFMERLTKKHLARKFFGIGRIFVELWLLTGIAAQLFVIQLAWFPIGNWDIWVTIGGSLLIGALAWLWSRRPGQKKSQRAFSWGVCLLIVMLFLGLICFLAMITGYSRLQAL